MKKYKIIEGGRADRVLRNRWLRRGAACLLVAGMLVLMGLGDSPQQTVDADATDPARIVKYIPTTDPEAPPANVEPAAVKGMAETISDPVIWDVPLDADLQAHIVDTAESYGVDPALVLAVIGKESNYNAQAIGDNGRSFGLMQVQPRWHGERMDRLGCTDLLDPYQNVTVGVDILAEKLKGGLEWGLMAYNGGNPYAENMKADGKVSEYAQTVIMLAEELKGDSK